MRRIVLRWAFTVSDAGRARRIQRCWIFRELGRELPKIAAAVWQRGESKEGQRGGVEPDAAAKMAEKIVQHLSLHQDTP